jgi:peptide-methionine (S)-S-oxide reductase
MKPSTTLILGAGCFWKTEAALRFLHGVVRTEVGYIALPLDGMEPMITPVRDSPRLWWVEVVALEVDLDVLPLERLMEVFWLTHTASEMWNPGDVDFLSCRSLAVVPEKELHARVRASIAERSAVKPIKTRLYESAAYLRASEADQDFFVCHPEDSFSTSQIIPCLKKIWKAMPEQMDLDIPD